SLRAMEDPIAQNAAGVALFGSQWEDLGGAAALDVLDPVVDGLGAVGGAAQTRADTASDNLMATRETLQRRRLQTLTEALSFALPYFEKLADWIGQKVPVAVDKMRPVMEAAFTWIRDNVPPVLARIGDFITENVV